MQVPPDVKLEPPIGQCIYCLSDSTKLSDEHIVPLSFGGNQVLQAASCEPCAAVTSAIEGHCTEHMFKALRVHHLVKTRRPKRRPTHLTVKDGVTPDNAVEREIPVADAPGEVAFPIFTFPKIMGGHPDATPVTVISFPTTADARERIQRLKSAGMSGVLIPSEFEPLKFARVLAKIAHGFAVHCIGLNGFRAFLPPVIFGEDTNAFIYVGCAPEGALPIPQPGSLFQLSGDVKRFKGTSYFIVYLRIFSHIRPHPPGYAVVAGEHPLA